MQENIIYLGPRSGSELNPELNSYMEIMQLTKHLMSLDYIMSRFVQNLFFEHGCDHRFWLYEKETEYWESSVEWSKQSSKPCDMSYDEFVNFCKQGCGDQSNITWALSPSELDTIMAQIPILPIRRMASYDLTKEQLVNIQINNAKLLLLNEGNQWTLFSESTKRQLIKQGYYIEVFGSPFNSLLPYFGSIYPGDEPLGRIGTAQEIIGAFSRGEKVYWRGKEVAPNCIINFPSGEGLIKTLVPCIIEMLSAIPCKIIVCVSETSRQFMKPLLNCQYLVKEVCYTEAWSYSQFQDHARMIPKKINLIKRPWMGIHLSSL